MTNIFDNLDLNNNTIQNARIILSDTAPTAAQGALKYISDGTSSSGLYLFYRKAGESTAGWHMISGESGSQIPPDDGKFYIKKATTSNAHPVSSDSTALNITVDNTPTNTYTGTTVYFKTHKGKIRISDGITDTDKFIELNLAGELTFYAEFTINSSTTQYVTLDNPLQTTNLIVSLYVQKTYKPAGSTGNGEERNGWEKASCEVLILNPQDGCKIYLTLHNPLQKNYKVVVVGAPSVLSDSGTAAEEQITARRLENSEIDSKTSPTFSDAETASSS